MGIPLISKIEPKNAGAFPVVEDIHMEGGLRVVDDLTARDNIPTLNRKEGMFAFVVGTGDMYRLDGGILNGDWALTPFGAGVSSVNGDSGPAVLIGLTEILAENNISGGTDLQISAGDTLTGQDNDGSAGSDLNIKAGDALTGNEDGGDLILTPGIQAGSGVVGEVRVAGDLNVTGKLTVAGSIDPTDVTFSTATAPSTSGTQGAIWVSDGSGSLVAGDLYGRRPSDGTIFNLFDAAASGNALLLDFACTATEAVGDVVYISTNDTVAQALADAPSTSNGIGIITSKATSTTCKVVTSGVVSVLSGLTAGLKYYLSESTPGEISSTPPGTPTEVVLAVGIAINATTLYLRLDPPLLLT